MYSFCRWDWDWIRQVINTRNGLTCCCKASSLCHVWIWIMKNWEGVRLMCSVLIVKFASASTALQPLCIQAISNYRSGDTCIEMLLRLMICKSSWIALMSWFVIGFFHLDLDLLHRWSFFLTLSLFSNSFFWLICFQRYTLNSAKVILLNPRP